MEQQLLPWTYEQGLVIRLLAVALVGQIAVTIWVYSQMSKARMTAALEKRVTAEVFKTTREEPDDLRVYSRAVANQFELPVIFYALVAASLALSVSSWITVILAFAFLGVRIVHIHEMIGENRVMLRRSWFIRSVQIVMAMTTEFVVSAVLFAQS